MGAPLSLPAQSFRLFFRPPFDTRAHSVHLHDREYSILFIDALLIGAWWCHWCCRCVDVGVIDVLTSHRLILTLLRLILFLPSGIHVCTVIGVDIFSSGCKTTPRLVAEGFARIPPIIANSSSHATCVLASHNVTVQKESRNLQRRRPSRKDDYDSTKRSHGDQPRERERLATTAAYAANTRAGHDQLALAHLGRRAM